MCARHCAGFSGSPPETPHTSFNDENIPPFLCACHRGSRVDRAHARHPHFRAWRADDGRVGFHARHAWLRSDCRSIRLNPQRLNSHHENAAKSKLPSSQRCRLTAISRARDERRVYPRRVRRSPSTVSVAGGRLPASRPEATNTTLGPAGRYDEYRVREHFVREHLFGISVPPHHRTSGHPRDHRGSCRQLVGGVQDFRVHMRNLAVPSFDSVLPRVRPFGPGHFSLCTCHDHPSRQ